MFMKKDQPSNLFTLETYKELLEQYDLIVQKQNELSYKNLSHRDKIASLWEQRWALTDEYRSKLPNYILACCPICGGKVRESIDTFSLNGIGWGSIPSGYGWYGKISAKSSPATDYDHSIPSYIAECSHVKIVLVNVNLNSIEPNDVVKTVWLGSEHPFIMKPILEFEHTYAVIHSLPIGRYDSMQKPYTAYVTVYFSNDDSFLFDSAMKPAYQEGGLVLYDSYWADYNLQKWVDKKKLFWLISDSSKPSVVTGGKIDFPYNDIKGLKGLSLIQDKKLRLHIGLSHQKSRKNLFKQIFGHIKNASNLRLK